MTEPNLSGGGPDSVPAPICPWCSAPLKTGSEETCPSCGAALHEVAESEVPGVTRVDHEAILKARAPVQRGRGLIGWLAGEYEAGDAAPPESPGSIAPPDEAVRREMLRLEMAALEAEAQARQAAVAAEIAQAGGTAGSEGGATEPDAGAAEPDAGAAEPDAGAAETPSGDVPQGTNDAAPAASKPDGSEVDAPAS